MNKHELGGAYVITAPSTVTVASTLTTCNVVYSAITYPMSCSVAGSTITLSSGFVQPVTKGDSI